MGCWSNRQNSAQNTATKYDNYRNWHIKCRLHLFDARRVGTARIFGTGTLLTIRALLFAYTLGVWIFTIVYDAEHGNMKGHFVYFTYLSYTGVLAYLASSLVHTVQHWRHGAPSSFTLMPKTLQLLHWFLYESVVLYAVVVTAMFWSLIYSSADYSTTELRWSTASVHATNTICVVVDTVIGSMVLSPHWSHPLLLCIIFALYLALTYINYAVNGWFVYTFLDYKKHKSMEAAIIFGLLAIFIVVYYVIFALQLLLDRLLPPKFEAKLASADDENMLFSDKN